MTAPLVSLVIPDRALSQYKAGNYASVPGRVGTAIANDPPFVFNRGAFSILVRSLAGSRETPRPLPRQSL